MIQPRIVVLDGIHATLFPEEARDFGGASGRQGGPEISARWIAKLCRRLFRRAMPDLTAPV